MTTRRTTAPLATTTHTFQVTPFAASGPGALSGHEMQCSCGNVQRTSLSDYQAAALGWKHLDWHVSTGR